MGLDLDIRSYGKVIEPTLEANRLKSKGERADLLRPHIFPVQPHEGSIPLPDGRISYAAYHGNMINQEAPKIVPFLTMDYICFAYAILGFEHFLKEEEVRNIFSRSPVHMDESDRILLTFGTRPWRPEPWETYLFRAYDQRQEPIFDGKFVHGHHKNGNGWREITYHDGTQYRTPIGWGCDDLFTLIILESFRRLQDNSRTEFAQIEEK